MWGATKVFRAFCFRGDISIHVPHVGRDEKDRRRDKDNISFQSTCPMWGATSIRTKS